MEKLVFVQLTGLATAQMKMDEKCALISDNGLFMVTTPSNSKKYAGYKFEPVDEDAANAYSEELKQFKLK